MRIAQIAPLFESVPPQFYGGTERVVSYLTEELVAQGHDVTLFASGDSVTGAKLIPACRRALRLDSRVIDPIALHSTMLANVMERASDFDILHFHVDYLHFPFSRKSDVPNVTTLHGRLDIAELQPLYRAFPEAPVVSISLSQRQPLGRANWVGNIYHGLPSDNLKAGRGAGKYLAFIGRISREKRVDRAIQIAIEAGMQLKIAAKVDPSDVEYYESKIKPLMDHSLVEYIGEIAEHEKAKFLGDAYAQVFPIDWPEPFGLCMIEAMACGTPTIAFDHGSVREVLTDGLSGFIVKNVEEAVRAVPKIAELSRAACRREFDRRFTVSRMAEDYVTVYESLVRDEELPVAVAKVGSSLSL